MIRFNVNGLGISIIPTNAEESEELDELAGLVPANPQILWYFSSGTDPKPLSLFSERSLADKAPGVDLFVYTDIGRFNNWAQIQQAYDDWYPELGEHLYWPGSPDFGCENAFKVSRAENPVEREITTMVRVCVEFNPPIPTYGCPMNEFDEMRKDYVIADDGTRKLRRCDGFAMLVEDEEESYPVLWLMLLNEVALEVLGRLRFPVRPYHYRSNVDSGKVKNSLRGCQAGVDGGYAGPAIQEEIYQVADRILEFRFSDISIALGRGSSYDAVFAFPKMKGRLDWYNATSGTQLIFVQKPHAPTKEVFGRILQFSAVKIAVMPFGREKDNECLVEWLEGKLWTDSVVRHITLFYVCEDDWRDISWLLWRHQITNTEPSKEIFAMETQSITQLIGKLTVPSSDDGKKFIRTDRLDLIKEALRDSNYSCLADLPLAKIYNHRDFQHGKPSILVSCHIDSVYGEYFSCPKDGELHGTFDNSACNALLVEAMLNELLPAQVLVSFTGDEERNSRGADRTIKFLQKIDVFQNLEMVITLDLTEEHYGSCHFTIENHSVEKKNRESLLKFGKKQDMMDYLSGMIDSPVFVRNADPDESWLYREYDLNCFSLCLPCRLLGDDMHDDTGVAVTVDSLVGYINILRKLLQAVNNDLTDKAL